MDELEDMIKAVDDKNMGRDEYNRINNRHFILSFHEEVMKEAQDNWKESGKTEKRPNGLFRVRMIQNYNKRLFFSSNNGIPIMTFQTINVAFESSCKKLLSVSAKSPHNGFIAHSSDSLKIISSVKNLCFNSVTNVLVTANINNKKL